MSASADEPAADTGETLKLPARGKEKGVVEEYLKAWDILYVTFKKGMDALNTEEYKKDLPQRWGKEYERKGAKLYKNYCDGFVASNKLAGNDEADNFNPPKGGGEGDEDKI